MVKGGLRVISHVVHHLEETSLAVLHCEIEDDTESTSNEASHLENLESVGDKTGQGNVVQLTPSSSKDPEIPSSATQDGPSKRCNTSQSKRQPDDTEKPCPSSKNIGIATRNWYCVSNTSLCHWLLTLHNTKTRSVTAGSVRCQLI